MSKITRRLPIPLSTVSLLMSLLVLMVVAIASLHGVYAFGQNRAFSIDEYQFGHATWLMGQGEKPYVDFYEHHFPMSYALHAPLFSDPAPGQTQALFSDRALRLRKIVFLYILAACGMAALATLATTRDRHEAVLASFLPITFGFGLMSAIDYRADSIGAFAFVACLLLLEWNRERGRLGVAVLCGALAMLCAFMTQKLAAVGGATIVLFLGLDLVRRRLAKSGGGAAPCIASPGAFVLSGGVVLAAVLGLAALFDILPRAFEITILDALEHEEHYPEHSLRSYLEPFLSSTAFSTIPILFFAALYLAAPVLETPGAGFWRCAVAVALVGGALVKAKYPYNYVYLSFLITFCSVRGFAACVRAIGRARPGWAAALPVLYLLPLAVIPDQLGFVAHTTGNQHQLAVLDKMQRFSSPEDAFIDNAGAGLFRPSASYFYQHGRYHRMAFREYFRDQLPQDYRESRALFWIDDVRSSGLPLTVRAYLNRHYIRVHRDLHALGFMVPRYSPRLPEFGIDVIRGGYYHILRRPDSAAGVLRAATRFGSRPETIVIDGERVGGDGVELSEGPHTITLEVGSASFGLSLLPPEAFVLGAPMKGRGLLRHSILFEHDRAK